MKHPTWPPQNVLRVKRIDPITTLAFTPTSISLAMFTRERFQTDSNGSGPKMGSDCWFASDVTAAMLVVKNKRVSLRWEMNSILMQILQKNFFCINHQHGRLVTWLQTKNRPALSAYTGPFWNRSGTDPN